PGEEITQAVSLEGQPYTGLPAAFQYRKALSPECGCRRPGESWADAFKNGGADTTVAPGDVVVTEQTAKRLSLPRFNADQKTVPSNADSTTATKLSPHVDASRETDPAKNKVRAVGPTFLPAR